MRYYFRQAADERIEGPYEVAEIASMLASGRVGEGAEAVAATGQSAWALARSNEWRPVRAVLGSAVGSSSHIPESQSDSGVTAATVRSSIAQLLTGLGGLGTFAGGGIILYVAILGRTEGDAMFGGLGIVLLMIGLPLLALGRILRSGRAPTPPN